MLTVGPDLTSHEWGGRACLALVNSILWRRSEAPVEVLTGYGRLAELIGDAGWLADAEGLELAAEADPAAAEQALARTIDLREALFRLFSAVAAGVPVDEGDRRSLNDAMAEALPHVRLDDQLRAVWDDPTALDLPRWQAAASAGRLLTAEDLSRLKQCPGERCGWVFVDDSRNRSRRWCEPNQCGNRERVRAYYRRSKAD
jgi:predicted RNA-binding Zn ribbon-like protein